MSETQRLFIALPVVEELRQAAARVQAVLREADADLSCPRPDHLHFTLVFLGDTFPDLIPALREGLDAAAARIPAFRFHVSGLGFFGPPRRPRVVWAGVPEAPAALAELHQSVLAFVGELKFTMEKRPFHPHLTLGRIRSGRGLDRLTAVVDSHKGNALGWCPVERVDLMRSHPEEPRARYTILHAARLKGT